MIHETASTLKGKTVTIKSHVEHPQVPDFGGSKFHVENWWDWVSGQSWMDSIGNPACIVYAARTGFSKTPVPTDNEVLYGKVGHLGHLVHISELQVEGEEDLGVAG